MKHFIIAIIFSTFLLAPASSTFSGENTEQIHATSTQKVYVTPTGKRYHYADCRTLARSKKIIAMSIQDAKQSRRTPCKVCKPALALLHTNVVTPQAAYEDETQEKNSVRNPTPLSASSSWQGLCIGVSDGDTITILRDGNTPVKIRLYGIDTPERKQAFGMRAKLYTSQLVFQQKVHVQTIDIDRYNREVALITLPDSSLLQTKILENGMAWVYTKYCKLELRSAWQALEAKSKHQKLGLWQDENAIAPWQWRKEKRKKIKKIQAEPLKQQNKAQVHALNSKSHAHTLNQTIRTKQIANF